MGLPEGWLLQHKGQRERRPGRVATGDAGNDATQAGTYQNERGKAKSTAIDVTGHAKYNAAPLWFPVSPYLILRISQDDLEI